MWFRVFVAVNCQEPSRLAAVVLRSWKQRIPCGSQNASEAEYLWLDLEMRRSSSLICGGRKTMSAVSPPASRAPVASCRLSRYHSYGALCCLVDLCAHLSHPELVC